ncbi:hypothetical protein HMPREF1556_00440 [Porphyromonas sp. oral taxon 278 str. W7784]|nr:hypothetical protein HMPREF1556_00440 [Porphyromonas sp. oral taxon 278 str. W7784]
MKECTDPSRSTSSAPTPQKRRECLRVGRRWNGWGRDCYRKGKKKPTVGRLTDLPWVGETTYSRFFRRPPWVSFSPFEDPPSLG